MLYTDLKGKGFLIFFLPGITLQWLARMLASDIWAEGKITM